jgi:hypothetical protein
MRRGLAVVGVALAVVLAFKSLVAPSRVLAPTTNQISISGLHVAQSDAMKSIPADIVPLP